MKATDVPVPAATLTLPDDVAAELPGSFEVAVKVYAPAALEPVTEQPVKLTTPLTAVVAVQPVTAPAVDPPLVPAL